MVRCNSCNLLYKRQFCRFFYCLELNDTVEFNRLQCPNDKMYDDVVFADRFRYSLAMLWNRLLIGLSRLLHANIAYEIDTAKIITAFFRISYCFYDFIWLNSIPCRVQTTRYTIVWFSLLDSVVNWLCLKYMYWYGYIVSYILILHLK